MRLVRPTKESIRKFYKTNYENDAKDFTALYKSIFKLIKVYPSHNKFAHVLPKSIVINQLYSTNIIAIKQMAKHIIKLNLNALIKKGSPAAVNLISTNHGIRSKKKNTEFDFYSFATKYCHSHNPAKYPIYDRYVDHILWEYKKKADFSVFKRKELKDYNTFLRVLKDFKTHYKIGKMSSNILDKFFWVQGAKYFTKKNGG